jgi:hypothetical protein
MEVHGRYCWTRSGIQLVRHGRNLTGPTSSAATARPRLGFEMRTRAESLDMGLDVRVVTAQGVHTINVRKAIRPLPGDALWRAFRRANELGRTLDTARQTSATIARVALGTWWLVRRAASSVAWSLRRPRKYAVLHRVEDVQQTRTLQCTAQIFEEKRQAVSHAEVLASQIEAGAG